jgi:hypothetical protein|tara:strand:- start:406 stop:579 length:174 start_codon:yes stop_codon:yes gene_type:complete
MKDLVMSIKHKIKFKKIDEDNKYKGGAAYKALLKLFANYLDDEKFAKHCKKFFKGEK